MSRDKRFIRNNLGSPSSAVNFFRDNENPWWLKMIFIIVGTISWGGLIVILIKG